MGKYTIKLLTKRDVAAGTTAFTFAKPDGFVYKPGQFCDFTIQDPTETDAEGNTRGFSLASAPYEETLMIATRMRNTAFKRQLAHFEEGRELEMDGPYGDFTLHNRTATPAVFLTGGIGITPVRSIIMQSAHENIDRSITLLYANRKEEDAAFLDELTKVAETYAPFTFVPVMTQPEASWKGEKGHITREMLQRYIQDLNIPIYYLSGPAPMVSAMRQMLNSAGVDDDFIRAEEFSGY